MQNERQWHHYYTWQKTTIQGRWKNSEGAKQIFWYETGRHFKVLKDQDQFKEKNKKFAKRIKADAQTKSRYRNNQVQYDLNNSTVDQLDDLAKLRIKKGSWNDKKSNGGHKKQKWIKIGDKSTRWVENFDWICLDSTASNSEDNKNLAEARALKKQHICSKTYHTFSSSAQWFWNAQENTEFQVQRGPGFTTLCNQPQQ